MKYKIVFNIPGKEHEGNLHPRYVSAGLVAVTAADEETGEEEADVDKEEKARYGRIANRVVPVHRHVGDELVRWGLLGISFGSSLW